MDEGGNYVYDILKKKITECLRQEEINRAKRRVYEELLEELETQRSLPESLDEGQDTQPASSPQEQTADTQKVRELVNEILSDGQVWRLTDLYKTVQKRIDDRLPKTTLNAILKKSKNISKRGKGLYQLSLTNEERPAKPLF
jgi:hypothetical protein